jgi:hypothetical protein
MHPTVESSLVFISRSVELDFDAISRTLKLEATGTRSLHKILKSGVRPPLPSSEWWISTGSVEVDSLDDSLEKLFLLLGNPESIRSASAELECDVLVITRVTSDDVDDRPFYELGTITIGKLTAIGAKWELDVTGISRTKG